VGEATTGRSQRIAGLDLLRGLSVVPLRGNALTYLAGGPAIAVLTAVLLLTWGLGPLDGGAVGA